MGCYLHFFFLFKQRIRIWKKIQKFPNIHPEKNLAGLLLHGVSFLKDREAILESALSESSEHSRKLQTKCGDLQQQLDKVNKELMEKEFQCKELTKNLMSIQQKANHLQTLLNQRGARIPVKIQSNGEMNSHGNENNRS